MKQTTTNDRLDRIELLLISIVAGQFGLGALAPGEARERARRLATEIEAERAAAFETRSAA